MVARRPACPSQVLLLYKGVVGSGGVVIQRQHLAIVDTHVPVTATPLSLRMRLYLLLDRSRIFPAGHHRRACRLVSLDLHRGIESVSNCRVMLRKTYDTIGCLRFYQSNDQYDSPPSTSLPKRSLLGSMALRSYEMMGMRRRCWDMAGRLDDGHAFEMDHLGIVSYLFHTAGYCS